MQHQENPVTEAVIVSTARSPFGRAFKGSLKEVRPDDLAATVIQAALDKVPGLDKRLVEDLYLGCAEPSGRHGSNMAKVVATLLDLDATPAATINRFCASSAQTTRMAFHAIKAGEGDIFVSAGVECVSQYTDWAGAGGAKEDQQNGRFAEAQARTKRIAETNETWTDPREEGLLPDIYIAMGQTAENVATAYGISRERQDEWGVTSQNRAEAAIGRGFFDWEITPVTAPDGTVVSKDDGPRAGVTLEAVQALNPVFRQQGTVTAGNCCPLNDGAAALVIMSDTKAKELGLEPLARVVSTAATGLSPEIMGLGPVEATNLALKRAGLSIGDIDLYEINEAFAAQVIGSADQIGMDYDKLNVNGGAIAIGHPFGATGARITGTLINALRERDGQFGLETMCVGGGQGMAVIFERLSWTARTVERASPRRQPARSRRLRGTAYAGQLLRDHGGVGVGLGPERSRTITVSWSMTTAGPRSGTGCRGTPRDRGHPVGERLDEDRDGRHTRKRVVERQLVPPLDHAPELVGHLLRGRRTRARRGHVSTCGQSRRRAKRRTNSM